MDYFSFQEVTPILDINSLEKKQSFTRRRKFPPNVSSNPHLRSFPKQRKHRWEHFATPSLKSVDIKPIDVNIKPLDVDLNVKPLDANIDLNSMDLNTSTLNIDAKPITISPTIAPKPVTVAPKPISIAPKPVSIAPKSIDINAKSVDVNAKPVDVDLGAKIEGDSVKVDGTKFDGDVNKLVDPQVKADIDAEAKSKSGKTETDAEAKASQDSFAKKHAGKLILGLAAGIAAGLAYQRFKDRDGQPSEIEKIYKDPKSGLVAIKYKTPLKWCISDTVELIDTDSDPIVNGTFPLKGVLPENTVLIDREAELLFTEGKKGTIKVRTSFASQMSCVIAEGTKFAVDNVVKPVAGAALDVGKGLFKELFGDIGETAKIVIYIIIGLVVLGAVYKLYTMFKSDPAPTVIQVPTAVANKLFKSLRRSGAKLRF